MSDKSPFVDIELRVRYADTDQMGVAYHSNYLIWFEVGRTSYCRACGVTYADMERTQGAFLPVVEVRCRYRRPLRYDERFIVRTRLDRLQSRLISFRYEILDEDRNRTLATAETRHVVTDASGQPRRLPTDVQQALGSTPVETRLARTTS